MQTFRKTPYLIIGGGLTGLSLHYLLQKQGIESTIVEARSRLGGRIYTIQYPNSPPMEMGATWIMEPHKQLIQFLKSLNIELFDQNYGELAILEQNRFLSAQKIHLPPNREKIYRIKGGTATLIQRLAKSLNPTNLLLDEKVKSISLEKNKLVVHSDKSIFEAEKVISTLPPSLFDKQIEVFPRLGSDIRSIMENTHTWMAESIKISLSFSKPFWKSNTFQGTFFSHLGPVVELYDHSDADHRQFALMGFIHESFHTYSAEDRKQLVLKQLSNHFGTHLYNYTHYEELVWRKQSNTHSAYINYLSPHQNNGHGIFDLAYLDKKLLFAGAETSSISPGYMQGAVASAHKVFKALLS